MKLSYLQKSKKNRQFYLASSIFLVLFSLSLASCTDKKKEFESLRTQVNSTLKYSLLEKEDRLQIIENSLDSNEKLIATYHVSINDEKRKKNGLGFAYPFALGKYTFETGGSLPDNGICQKLESLENKSLLENISSLNPKLKVGIGTLALETELSETLRVLSRGKPSRIYILVKGWADASQTKKWSAPMDSNYKFGGKETIEVYPAFERTSNNPIKYVRKPEKAVISSGGKYRNENLANLRAKFIADDIIGQNITGEGGCLSRMDKSISSIVHTHILNGYTMGRVDPGQRRAEIYLQIYVKKDWWQN